MNRPTPICEPIDPEIPTLASHAVQLIQRDRKVAHARSGRMIDRVGNCRGDANDPDLAKPLDAERVGVVRLVHENDLDVVHVGVQRSPLCRTGALCPGLSPRKCRRAFAATGAGSLPTGVTTWAAAPALFVAELASENTCYRL